MNLAKFMTLDHRDLIKGLVLAVLSSLATSLLTYFNSGTFPTAAQFHVIWIAGLGAGTGYLIKNFFTNSLDQLFKPEPQPVTIDPVVTPAVVPVPVTTPVATVPQVAPTQLVA
jgi:hypothetical protein